MKENEPTKEGCECEVVKIVFNRTYDLSLAGHDPSMFAREVYSLVYPSGLEIGLGMSEEQGGWGHWNYDFKNDKKTWVEIDLPENPRVKVIDDDGQYTEMSRLVDKWLETHESTEGDECREFINTGLMDFLVRTNQV